MAATGPSGADSVASVIKFILAAILLLSAWGVFAMQQNASSGSPSLPLGPVGTSGCRDAVAGAKANIPSAVREMQNNVDQLVAENPQLAPYAADAKRDLAAAAGPAADNLDQAGHSLGC